MVGFTGPTRFGGIRNLSKATDGLPRRRSRRRPHPEWPFVLLVGLLMLVLYLAVLSIW